MREILFRGKRVDNGEWVYGCLVHGAFFKAKDNSDIPYIFNIDDVDYDDFEDFAEGRGYYEVYPETVGMCVPGLTDKNGKKIFEGDIVRDHNGQTYEMVFIEKYSCYYFVHKSSVYAGIKPKDIEVIGNATDNPELLEVRG